MLDFAQDDLLSRPTVLQDALEPRMLHHWYFFSVARQFANERIRRHKSQPPGQAGIAGAQARAPQTDVAPRWRSSPPQLMTAVTPQWCGRLAANPGQTRTVWRRCL